jgi:hypothetical protein
MSEPMETTTETSLLGNEAAKPTDSNDNVAEAPPQSEAGASSDECKDGKKDTDVQQTAGAETSESLVIPPVSSLAALPAQGYFNSKTIQQMKTVTSSGPTINLTISNGLCSYYIALF